MKALFRLTYAVLVGLAFLVLVSYPAGEFWKWPAAFALIAAAVPFVGSLAPDN